MKISRLVGASLTLVTVFLLGPARADGVGERIEISAPIFPKTSVLYPNEGVHFPTTLSGEQAVAHDAALVFDRLMNDCSTTHPEIRIAGDGETLTPEELTTNYNEVAECAYQTYTSKPYWIPKLVDDVDLCGVELGSDWRLPTEADVLSLSSDEITFISNTLTAVAGGAGGMGSFYFSLKMYVRGSDSSLKQADLNPSASSRVSPLSVSGDALKAHYEGGVSLRCIRRVTL